jgi:hypothetical protein
LPIAAFVARIMWALFIPLFIPAIWTVLGMLGFSLVAYAVHEITRDVPTVQRE